MENKNIKDKNQWTRILYMLLFAVVLYIAMFLVGLIAFVQIIFSLFTGKTNEDLKSFSIDLSTYVQQIVSFLLYVDNRRPFPFNDIAKEGESTEEQPATPETEAPTTETSVGIDDDRHSSR